LFIGLTSIHWREEWKYGQRAYRYCQHDVGHAVAAVNIAAASLGWQATLLDDLGADELALLMGTACHNGAEQEVPDLFDALVDEGKPDDVCHMCLTSGTTGLPKGAMLTHGNVLSNTLQGYEWIRPALKAKNPYVITALPLYHIFALQANGFITIKLGGCSHLITNPRDIRSFLKEIAHVRFNIITGVNTLFNAMLNHPDFKSLDFSRLELAMAGGMAVMQATAKAWQELTGKPLIEAYGLTESSPALTGNPVDLEHFNGSIGLPLPSTEISIRDDDGNSLPAGTAGELWARGPQVMKSYWNRPDETRQVLTDDGWLKTGDIATMDEKGYVRIIDRKKDMIIISGFNVYPSEIENVLISHPDISEAGVIGVPDEKNGESIKAILVSDKKTLSEDQVIAWCRQHLTAYKIPKLIEFRDELPKTNVGKILRRELR